jgi:hypothetical protein
MGPDSSDKCDYPATFRYASHLPGIMPIQAVPLL